MAKRNQGRYPATSERKEKGLAQPSSILKTLSLFTSITFLTLLLTASVVKAADKPVHLFILSGQSNMQGMDPETGFMPEAKKLFGDEEIVYIKVAKGGQPICRWLEEWVAIAKEKGLDEKHIKRIHKDGKVEFYQPILDQYKEMLEKHPKFASVTFCWMQGERDASPLSRSSIIAANSTVLTFFSHLITEAMPMQIPQMQILL